MVKKYNFILIIIIITVANSKMQAQKQVDSLPFNNSIKYQNDIINSLKAKGRNAEYYNALGDLAFMYEKKSEFQQAIQVRKERIEYFKINLLNIKYADELMQVSNDYLDLNDYEKVEQYVEKSLEIQEQISSITNPYVYGLLKHLASIYQRNGKLNEEEKCYKKILNKLQSENSTNNDELGYVYSRLGQVYLLKEDIIQSEEYLTIGANLLINSRTLKKDYYGTLVNLGQLNLRLKKLPVAEKLLIEAIEGLEKVFNKENPKVIFAKIQMAFLYNQLGLYKKSINLLLVDINSANVDFTLPEQFYSVLGDSYIHQNDYSNAEKFYLKAFEINPHGGSNYNLVKIYSESNPSKSIELFINENEKIKQEGKENNLIYNLNLYSLSVIYDENGDKKNAESTYNQFFKTFYNKEMVSQYNPKIFFKTGLFFENINKIDFSVKSFAIGLEVLYKSSTEKVNFLSESEIIKSNQIQDYRKSIIMSFLNRNPTKDNEILVNCFQNIIVLNSLVLNNKKNIFFKIKKSGDIQLINRFEKFIDNKRKIVKLNELPIEKRPSNFEQLSLETETLEKELIRESNSFADARNALSVNWKQVREKLKPNEIAIDLVAFQYYNQKWTDSIVYSAFVIGPEYKFPKYIPLFEQKQLEVLLAKSKNEKESTRVDKQYSEKSISDLFLKPLEEELKGLTTIYLSPSGLGNQIDFAALPVSETGTLGEKFKTHILGSTAEIVNYTESVLDEKNKLELLLYGDIDYDKSEGLNSVVNEPLESNSDTEFVANATRSGITKWNYLAGTKKEVEQIKNNSQQNGFSSTIINGRQATEESIKKLDGRTTPFVLHLATHGFFFPDPKIELPEDNFKFTYDMNKSTIHQTSDDPMMRSGLLFAGANNYWGKPVEKLTSEDGILTSNEISNLDLSACQLVVLSACDTGLGDIDGSEGVFGLQRAFKMAGVKNIIMSLWKVPDAQTAELFDVFYGECFAGKTIHEAFQAAQAIMKAKYSPYYWAGFVLLE